MTKIFLIKEINGKKEKNREFFFWRIFFSPEGLFTIMIWIQGLNKKISKMKIVTQIQFPREKWEKRANFSLH